ncbi:MAG TPA: hypothetical protein PKA00_01395 [Saprospiraceae bacterium]|mgnify:CR=1 FL=1|nr:hypothetical protein [Saprospiraceae bacterium]HMQ81523.1 hypothetical protein [Saprospiraceae bacterium]
MKSRQAPQPTLFGTNNSGQLQHQVLSVPVLAQAIRSLHPELFDQSEKSRKVLDRIERYLFLEKKCRYPAFEPHLREELCTVLYGFKTMLHAKGQNLTTVLQNLETDQERYRLFLNDLLED